MIDDEEYGSALAAGWKLASEWVKDPEMLQKAFSAEELAYIEETVAIAELILIALFPAAGGAVKLTRCSLTFFDALARANKGLSVDYIKALSECMPVMGRSGSSLWKTIVGNRNDAAVAALLGRLSKNISKPLQRVVAALSNRALQKAWASQKGALLSKLMGPVEYRELMEAGDIAQMMVNEGWTAAGAKAEIFKKKLRDPEWMRDHQQAARHMVDYINSYKKEAKKVEKMSGYSGLIYRQQHPSIAEVQANSGHRAPGYFPELYHRSGGRFYTDQVDEFGGLVYRVQHPSIAEIQANSGHRAPGYFPELYHRSGGRFYTDQVDEFGEAVGVPNDFLNALWGV